MGIGRYLSGRVSPATAKRYLGEIRAYIESVGEPELAAHADIMAHIGRIREDGKGAGPALAAIKAYHAYMVDSGIRQDDPAISIRLRDAKSPDIQLQDLFTPQELQKLLDARAERYPSLAERNRVAMSLLVCQALTVGEICRLRVSDIDIGEGTASIAPSRKNAGRVLGLRAWQASLIASYIGGSRQKLLRQPSRCLILSKLGREENGEGIGYLLETARHLFPGKKLNARTVRQSVIANLLKEGRDLRIVQAFAGHKNPSTTEKYREADADSLREMVAKCHPFG